MPYSPLAIATSASVQRSAHPVQLRDRPIDHDLAAGAHDQRHVGRPFPLLELGQPALEILVLALAQSITEGGIERCGGNAGTSSLVWKPS